MRIAIFGLHAGTQASYRPDEWDQVWRMAHDPEAPQAHRIFEAHSEPIARKYGGEAYITRLREFAEDGLLVTLWPYEGKIRQAHWVAEDWRPQSSVAFMFACALREFGEPHEMRWSKVEDPTIGLFGVDMAEGEEYAYQRPDMMRLVGHARAWDVRVHIDPASSLLKSQWTAGIYGHPDNINDMVYRLT
jgi:hypothetical protein